MRAPPEQCVSVHTTILLLSWAAGTLIGLAAAQGAISAILSAVGGGLLLMMVVWVVLASVHHGAAVTALRRVLFEL